jgi:hypothetical protein
MKKELYIFLFVLLGIRLIGFGQSTADSSIQIMKAVVLEEDTIFVDNIREIYVFPERLFFKKFTSRRYRKLVRDIKKAYPYALLASDVLSEMDKQFSQLKTDRQKKLYIKKVEERLRDEFEDDLRGLTINQGIILMKLIDRETGDTSYELVKELKGSFSAFFWQTVARFFGSNLKVKYDPDGKDKLIEEIVQKIEQGKL